MTSSPVTYAQLTSDTFAPRNGADSDNEDNSQDASVAPQETTIRVTRPTDPIDFVLPRPILSDDDLHDLAFRPAALNSRVTCRIIRFRDGLDKLYPVYKLYIEHLATNEIHHVLTAKKQRKSQTSYYTIFGNIHNVDQEHPGAYITNEKTLGKVRSNFLGTSFSLYSHGNHPEKKTDISKKDLPLREELGAVLYDPNILGFKGPRKMTILTHTLTRDGRRPEFRPESEFETLLAKYKENRMDNMLVLHNKSPQWNEETQSFVLNFSGRVTQASVKNFQIVHDNDLDYIVMQFGRVDRDYFTLDYKYPICLLQAFAIALTSFDAKLACE
ncbi:Tub-domain-containing protein [Hesseltinella vesiculosa]|uniref:Tub-domain-containing protein n=1 Tax=Hesseltinella vesiculosa TaxID=101127 RepID=A0A1X2GTV9_9FUNG|nr:Tub-domain-containing protein [Hesseltinella vesiculosa]